MPSPYCPEYAPFFGFLGAALALVFGNMGAAYGTWKSALGLATIAKLPRHKVQTEMVMKSIMPVILSGVCGIFGLIIAVIISSGMSLPTGPGMTTYSLYTGYAHLGAGLTVGLSNLASGLAIGMCGNCGVQDSCRQPKLYIGMVLIWSFGSALGARPPMDTVPTEHAASFHQERRPATWPARDVCAVDDARARALAQACTASSWL
jgi:V-type H+-transporting ATPase proteolipid subunit